MQSPESSEHPTNTLKRNLNTMMTDRQQPTSYLVDVFNMAMRRNTIAHLDTGAEKTTIAVMIVKEIATSLSKHISDQKKLIIFLAPTFDLVEQNFNDVRGKTSLLVDFYHKSKVTKIDGNHVDEWDAATWELETNKNQVMVMTPQVLLDALRNGFMNFEMICLLIIDECHYAGGDHPYASIMKDFYFNSVNKPKVFGMTSSPVTKKGVSSDEDCEAQITTLESILDSLIYTIQDGTKVENVTQSASPKYSFYEPRKVDFEDLKLKLKCSRLKFEVQLLQMQVTLQTQYKDSDQKHGILRGRLSDDHAKITYCIDELGLLCAYEAVKICMADTTKAIEKCGFFQESCSKCVHFLEEALSIIENALPKGHENMFNGGCEFDTMVAAGYISPKLYELFKLFQLFGGATKLSSIILVEKITTAKVLDMILKRVADLSHFEASYLTANATCVDEVSTKMQKETLEYFRSGKVDLLFATGVIEEGIDLPKCSTVVCFDIPKTVRSNAQSWGRVRQSGTRFIFMLERNNEEQRGHVCDILISEHSMSDYTKKQDPDTCAVKPCNFKETKSSYVEATRGASGTPADSSVSLVHYARPRADDPFYRPSSSSSLSKQLVCLEASKKAHQIGDHVPPNNEENKSSKITKEPPPTAGTTRRKELHGTAPIRAVSATWSDDGADLYAYIINFTCSVVDIKFSSLVLLLESKLDDDVASLEMELYLVSKSVNCKVSSSGKLHLNSEQVTKGKCFQELFFNGIFGKLYVGSKHSEEPRQFLLASDKKLWNSSYMYFVLPLESSDPFKISWKEIDSCVSAIEFVKKSPFSRAEKQSVDSVMIDAESTNMVHFANRDVHKDDDVTNVVVLAIHTGKIYSIFKVAKDETADSPFDGDTTKYSSFKDYFKQKYEIDLVYPGQSMLLLKQSHRSHNLLVDFNGEGILHGKKIKAGSCKVNTNRQMCYAHLPPELLVIIDARVDIVKSLYLLPSLMHRLESFMLASQLREEINSQINIRLSLILEAITTLRCNESFSMERLELLGDSVLKYVVSCDLYLRNPSNDEGQLSADRTWQVRNSTLYDLGINRRLQSYIREIPFDPTRWTAPGQLPLKPCPCDHGVETIEVPNDATYHTEDPKVFSGRCCDMGHRWLVSKTISDCVEALVGAYFMGGGLNAALHFMNWMGISCELHPSRVNEAHRIASLHAYTPKLDVLQSVESKLGYTFAVKGLLLEAVTHASYQDQGGGYSYQRLEFLGDSALDLLITWHLFIEHSDIDPGELTDLRSACVNNESFSNAAVRRNLHGHLQYRSSALQTQISDYVKFLATDSSTLQTRKAPKAIGDLVESIAGAMLIDTKLDLVEVWRIFKELLSPIVTPDKLELPPYRELMEFCDSKGYFVKDSCRSSGDGVIVELRLQLEDALLVADGTGNKKKFARGQAALKMLSQIEVRLPFF
ncbi:endoribonuclease Dicer homolog 3-like [Bidens hawaiensis]|uniref:endoribonuclease Dicer homolog 3-like n=1 Tax=Bidens hawaiensis TaxID=980011 RepID=UPI00404A126A